MLKKIENEKNGKNKKIKYEKKLKNLKIYKNLALYKIKFKRSQWFGYENEDCGSKMGIFSMLT